MNEKVARALNVFINLDDNQKKEFLAFINEYPKYPHSTTKSINESLAGTRVLGVTFGPAPGSTCPYCGK